MSGSSVLEREMSLAARFHSDEAARYALALIKWSGPAAADQAEERARRLDAMGRPEEAQLWRRVCDRIRHTDGGGLH